MTTVAECLRQHGPAFLQNNADSTTVQVCNVLSVLTRCRTGELGSVVYQCDDCHRQHWVGRSCGNRHCPNCQHEKTQQWLKKQTERLLPVHHFLVTCTVPQEVRDVIRKHRKTGFDAIFHAGVQMLRTRTAKSRYLKDGELGFFGVLHTWGRDLQQFHPHVHFVVPGGAVTENAKEPTAITRREQRPASHDDPRHRPSGRPGWLSTPTNFLFPHGAMCREYRDFFKQIMEAAELLDEIPEDVWTKKWVVDIKPVGDGKAVLKYLAPYVCRVAISDNRILSCDEQSVAYRVHPSKGKPYTRTVPGERFVQSFAQHILPKQYSKIRHYGWMSSNSRFKIDSVRWLVWLWFGWTYWLGSGIVPPEKQPHDPLRCEHCGGKLTMTMITGPSGSVVWPRRRKYFDTS